MITQLPIFAESDRQHLDDREQKNRELDKVRAVPTIFCLP